jgi:cell division protein FtsB
MYLLRRNLWSLLALLLLLLFGAHTFFGDNGLKANAALKARVAGLTKQLKILEERHQALDARAKLLSSGSIDPDTLEGEARKTLNFVYPNEQVFLQKSP